MNIKYKDLSVIGKIWSLAELLCVGIRDKKSAYTISMFKKLTELRDEEEPSMAVKQNSFENIMENATNILHKSKFPDAYFEFTNDESVISIVWCAKTQLEEIKRRVEKDTLTKEDLTTLNEIYKQVHKCWIIDIKNKILSSKERRDLFKIQLEIKSYKERIEKRADHNQITII